MKLFCYARGASTDQDLTIQIEALKKAGVNEALIFSEKKSGTTTEGRIELARCLALMSEGDVLVVCSGTGLSSSARSGPEPKARAITAAMVKVVRKDICPALLAKYTFGAESGDATKTPLGGVAAVRL